MPEILFFLWITSVCSIAMATGTAMKGAGGLITCECTTEQCRQMQVPVCTTDSLCFVQRLGAELVRGCIGGRTPLLCENRRPSRARAWPLLHCCGSDLCNRGALPSPPPWHKDLSKAAASFLKPDPDDDQSDSYPDRYQGPPLEVTPPPESVSPPPPSSLAPTAVQRSPWPHIVSPVYLSVLVLGAVALVVIGIVAASVIRRNNRFYAEQYGALEYQRGKASRTRPTHQCDCCDSEVESVGSSQPYLQIVSQNQNRNT